jgi:phosphoribosylaminoimidazole-succinocarboxamide synthase
MLGEERMREVERVAIALYSAAAEYALQSGIIIADTKFEFGLDPDGTLVLGDEALTPDSSRFWPADSYEPGRGQDSFDKQYVRDYCETLGWNKAHPGPEVPEDVVAGTRAKYVEAFERLTKIPFDRYLDNPSAVLG